MTLLLAKTPPHDQRLRRPLLPALGTCWRRCDPTSATTRHAPHPHGRRPLPSGVRTGSRAPVPTPFVVAAASALASHRPLQPFERVPGPGTEAPDPAASSSPSHHPPILPSAVAAAAIAELAESQHRAVAQQRGHGPLAGHRPPPDPCRRARAGPAGRRRPRLGQEPRRSPPSSDLAAGPSIASLPRRHRAPPTPRRAGARNAGEHQRHRGAGRRFMAWGAGSAPPHCSTHSSQALRLTPSAGSGRRGRGSVSRPLEQPPPPPEQPPPSPGTGRREGERGWRMEEGPAATIIAAARPLAARSGGGKESWGGREEGLVEAAAPPVSLRRSDAGAGFSSCNHM